MAVLLADMGAGVDGWMHMSMGVGVDVGMGMDVDADGNGYAGCGDAVAAAPSDHGSLPLRMVPVLTDALMRVPVCTLMLFGWMPMPSGLWRSLRTDVDADVRMDMVVGACVIVVAFVVAGMEAVAKDEGIAVGADALMCVQAGKGEADGVSKATRACPDFHGGIRVHASTYAPPWTRMMMQGIDTRMMVPEGGR